MLVRLRRNALGGRLGWCSRHTPHAWAAVQLLEREAGWRGRGAHEGARGQESGELRDDEDRLVEAAHRLVF